MSEIKKTVEFIGEASGNGECAYWLIDWETLCRIDPEEAQLERELFGEDDDDDEPFVPDIPLEDQQFPYYPERMTESGKRYKVRIEVEEVIVVPDEDGGDQ